jgi:hypothetical protein
MQAIGTSQSQIVSNADADQLWHVALPAGVVSMTLDALDAAYQQDAIDENTPVFTAGMSSWARLGVVAGLSGEPEQAPSIPAPPSARENGLSGIRPRGYVEQAGADDGSRAVRRNVGPDEEFVRALRSGVRADVTLWLSGALARTRGLGVRGLAWFESRSAAVRRSLLVAAAVSAVVPISLYVAVPAAPSVAPEPEVVSKPAQQAKSFVAATVPVERPASRAVETERVVSRSPVAELEDDGVEEEGAVVARPASSARPRAAQKGRTDRAKVAARRAPASKRKAKARD